MSLYAPYKAYRPSHMAWLDEVPAHWSVSSLRWLSTRYTGGTPDRENPDFWSDGSIPWLNSGAVNDPVIHEPSAYISETGFAGSSAKWIPKGALVMALAGQGKTKGTVAQLGFSATCNQSMAALIPTERVDAKYLFWWLRSNYANVRGLSGGDLRDGLNLQLIGDIPVPLPSPNEQRTIADFLDRETAQIDELIGKQDRLIELLAEKRQTVITHAVTKGLDPTAPTKPSGIPWLGDIPVHWADSRLKFAVRRIDQGVSPQADGIPASSGSWGVLKSGCVNGGVFRESENKQLPSNFTVDPAIVVKVGDLLVSRASGSPKLVGSAARVRRLDSSLILSDKTFRFVPKPDIDADFLEWFLNSQLYREQVEGSISGAEGLANNISTTALKNIRLPLPPRAEQSQIDVVLCRETDALTRLVDTATKAVHLLEERRSALISAAVTGKIDVREGTA